jgi:plasmid replication protein
MPTKDSEKLKAARARADAKRVGRTRNFATVVYPDSAPADWKEKLDQLHVAAFISPLHDKDVNPNGELKKAHYHVLVMFEGPKDYDTQVKPIFDEIGAVGREIVNSARGYARYLCHLDNPEKATYSPSEVLCMGGADYYGVVTLPTDDLKVITEIKRFCRENEIYSLAEIIDIAESLHPEWYSTIVMSRCYVIDKYIKSLEWERASGYVRVENRTGKL